MKKHNYGFKKTNKISTYEANAWSGYIYISTFLGFFIPLANILAPLVIWFAKKNDHEDILNNGKEAINFQISWSVYLLLIYIIMFYLSSIVHDIDIKEEPTLVGIHAIFYFSIVLIIMVFFNVNVMLRAIFCVFKGERYITPLKIKFIK